MPHYKGLTNIRRDSNKSNPPLLPKTDFNLTKTGFILVTSNKIKPIKNSLTLIK